MRRAAKRDMSEKAIIAALRKAGVKVYPVNEYIDAWTMWAGIWLPLEFKNPGWNGKYSSKEQERFITENKVPVVTTPDEALREVGLI